MYIFTYFKLIIASIIKFYSTAFYIQLLIKINRTDLAQKEVSQMKSWADDAALAQLAETWLNLALVIYYTIV